jgi:RNA polymerase sigma factor (sigma-70 family)
MVHAAGRGEQEAVFGLYDWAHRLVFTVALRITGSREAAEEITVDVFLSIWRKPDAYHCSSASVLAEIMNEARSRATARLQHELLTRCDMPAQKSQQGRAGSDDFPRQALQLRLHGDRMRELLQTLTPGERRAVERTFFGEQSYVEAAERLGEPPALVKLRIRSVLDAASDLMSATEPDLAPATSRTRCVQTELVNVYALAALPPNEAAGVEAHIGACLGCQEELLRLERVICSFAAWPIDILRPPVSLRERLARRIAEEGGVPLFDEPPRQRLAAEWERVGPGISCKLLAKDEINDRVSMLVRLSPAAEYPPHTHAGTEELHLLHGELWIEDRKLFPGDYNLAEPGSSDAIVRSDTGCTCVLITSTRDVLSS